LLMAFFIMLLTMASGKSGKLCSEGEKFDRTLLGFRHTIASCGLPGLLGNPENSLDFSHPKITYNVTSGESNSPTRILDAEKERIQRIFDELDKMSRTAPSPMQGKRPQFSITPITFDPKQAVLNESAIQYLTKFITDLQEARSINGLAIYVVGLAPDTTNAKQQWLLAAQRAQAAAQFIKAALPASAKVSVCSWGCKKIDELAGLAAGTSQQTSILIGTLQTDTRP
jgi:outer membrane protein OmpA-like peptidoglycan-associated protein